LNSRTFNYSQGFLAPKRALDLSAKLWFSIAFIGQLFFVVYILAFYGLSAVQGNFAVWSAVLPEGFIQGDSKGNVALASHILLAALITLAGMLQLMPKIRAIAPKFHRLNGRTYIVAAFIMSLTGLYLVWTRGFQGGLTQHISISLNAFLIMGFAIATIRLAMAGNIQAHRRWALRLFMVVSGVWFFRVGLMFWLAVHQKPVGIDFETFTGPFIDFLGFAQYLLPLAILEMYLRTKENASEIIRYLLASFILLVSLGTAVGIVMVSIGMWLPTVFPQLFA